MTFIIPRCDRPASRAGFTLIELLVVLFIISIVTSVALLSIGRSEHKQLESFANELTQIVTLAEEQAMLQPAVLGLMIDDRSFHFATLQPAMDNKKHVWVPLQDAVLSKRTIPNDIQLHFEVGGVNVSSSDDAMRKKPQIIISTNGDVTPFTIYLGKKGHKPSFVIIGSADGNVTSKALS